MKTRMPQNYESCLAIDPGNEQSAFVVLDKSFELAEFGKLYNNCMLDVVRDHSPLVDVIAIETPHPRGQMMTWQLISTAIWIGRFLQAVAPVRWVEVDRIDVKMHVCADPRAKDSNIRSALVERWGGKDRAVGKKANPGPLYGVSKDVWQALGVGVTVMEGVLKQSIVHAADPMSAIGSGAA